MALPAIAEPMLSMAESSDSRSAWPLLITT
jgi:hypothetical protein